IGLRTFSAVESRTVLGVPDAYELPPIPGMGYLKVDTTVWERFRAALVSGPYRPPTTDRVESPRPAPFPAVTAVEAAGDGDGDVRPEDSEGPSVLDVLVDLLKDAADKVHQVGVPPLPAGVGLDLLLGRAEPDPQRGLVAAGWPGTGRLRVALGVVDRPLAQRM